MWDLYLQAIEPATDIIKILTQHKIAPTIFLQP